MYGRATTLQASGPGLPAAQMGLPAPFLPRKLLVQQGPRPFQPLPLRALNMLAGNWIGSSLCRLQSAGATLTG
jgi:hypothetical protein